MSITTKFSELLVLLAILNSSKGSCPFAQQYYDVLSRNADLEQIYKDYMSSTSYDTYETDCYRYVSQPPPISDTIIDHALNSSIDRTNRYISLDIHTVAGEKTHKPHDDMDRNNYFFESATKYVQETTCSSKNTTTMHLSRLQVEKFESYAKKDVTKIACDGGHVKYPSCSSEDSYRPVDGACNNLKRPLDGRVGDCMLRLLPPDFKDGISQFRTSKDGSPLPNARVLSINLFGQEDNRPLSSQYTEFHTFLGEFVIGDNAMTLFQNLRMFDLAPQSCDQNNQRVNHPQYTGIPVPPNDTIHETYPDQTCMQFVRSLPCARCRLGPRMMSNSVTAAQDLNSVYGVSTDMSDARRTMVGGRLQSQTIRGDELFAIERFNNSGRFRCFEGKCEQSPFDVRNVQLPTGQAIALLFHRNHNRHARKLAKIQPAWTDEQIFQEARRWNIAEYQHCVFNEYVKTLTGCAMAKKFGILPEPIGQFSKYKPDVALKTIIEFQTTAGRHGHAALTEDINIVDPSNGKESKINFRDSAKAESIFYEGLVDGMFLAQFSRPTFETTPSIPFKTFLFNLPGRPFGQDLATLDIHRQRDHGIPGYIYYLKYCHDVDVHRWEDLLQFMDSESIDKLKKYYKFVEDVELYVGGRFERKAGDALVGPTFASIIGLQFHNVKYGDRFFYEHGSQTGSFEVDQLNEIKTKSSFASIFCKNTNLKKVVRDPLRLKSETNQLVECSEFEDIDYKFTILHKPREPNRLPVLFEKGGILSLITTKRTDHA